MTSQLSPAAIERLRDDFHFSGRVMSPERAATFAGRFEAFEQTERAPRLEA
jgi:hypothetical protein